MKSEQPAYQHYVLLVLVLGYILNTIDRGVYGVLLQSIKEEIHASDFALGLLGGLAFSLCYSFAGIFLARLADRWNRVNILSAAIGVWSLATAACGLAWNYTTLFLTRALTALGEAGGSPPSHSLISDYFSSTRRATALAIYAAAVPFGTAIGNYGAGWFNEWYGWRATFLVVGLPGVLVALLAWLTIREPPRVKEPTSEPFFGVFKFLLSKTSFIHMSLGAALHAVVWYSGTIFNPAFFIRTHELSSGEAGSYIAIFSLIGAVGGFTGGYLADKLSQRTGDARWSMWVPGIACLLVVPLQFVAYLSTDLALTVPIAFSLMFAFASFFFGPSFAVAQSVATVRTRATAAAVLLFIQTMIGLTLGPAIVGWMSDFLVAEHGSRSLANALAIIGIVNVWAAAHYFIAARSYREDLSATAKLNAA